MNSERPASGDTVKYDGVPDLTGVVLETFYRNGNGMHVYWTQSGRSWPSWAPCNRVTVVKRVAQTEAT